MANRWELKALKALFNGIGAFGLSWFQRKSGKSYDWPNAPVVRSRDAIYAKIRREYGGGGLTRGVYSRGALVLVTGYDRRQLERAQVALNQ